MYCYNCGKKIYNGMGKCPYCDVAIKSSDVSDLLLENTWAEIARKCPEMSLSRTATFDICGEHITLSKDYYVLAQINSFINRLERDVTKLIDDYYSYWHLDVLVEKGEIVVSAYLLNAANAVTGFKYRNSSKVSKKDKEFLRDMSQKAESVWEPIYYIAEEFDDLRHSLAEHRKSIKKEKSSYWVGGGFGVRGAIKGKIKADLMNAGASASNALGNVIRRSIQAGIDRANIEKMKREVHQSNELRNAVFAGVECYFNECACYLIDALCKEKEKAKSIYALIRENSEYVYADSIADAVQMLSVNPFNIGAYSSIYSFDRNQGEPLSQLAIFCGIEEEVWYEFVESDTLLWEDQFKSYSLGYDTTFEELLKIKDQLGSFVKNNPAYTSSNPIIQNELVDKVRRLHLKLEEILTLRHINHVKKVIDDSFSKKSFSESVNDLLKRQDPIIDNFVFNKIMTEIRRIGYRELAEQFESNIPTLVIDAISIFWFQNKPDDYESSLETLAKLGHVFPMAYYGEHCLKYEDEVETGMKYIMKAAEHQCAIALFYMGDFYKNGTGGFYRDCEVSRSYYSISASLGNISAKERLRK